MENPTLHMAHLSLHNDGMHDVKRLSLSGILLQIELTLMIFGIYYILKVPEL